MNTTKQRAAAMINISLEVAQKYSEGDATKAADLFVEQIEQVIQILLSDEDDDERNNLIELVDRIIAASNANTTTKYVN